jgi:oligopeptidase B
MNPDANTATPAPTQETSAGTILKPPVARREPVEHVLHGDRRVDHYAWLRHKENAEVIDYLNAENAYANAILKPTEALQEKLYQEMLGRILQTDLSVPYKLRGYLYFTRTEEGKQYAFHCRRRDAEGAAEELLLDLNLLAEGHSFLGLGSFDVSEDNHLLAYSIDNTGFQQYVLQVKDLRTGSTFPERFERVTSVAWASDNRTLFYTVEDETTKRSHRLYRHVLGSTETDHLSQWSARAAGLFYFSRLRVIPPAKSATWAPVRPPENFGYSLRAKTTMNITLTITRVRLPRNIPGRQLIRMRGCFTFARIPAGAPSDS